MMWFPSESVPIEQELMAVETMVNLLFMISEDVNLLSRTTFIARGGWSSVITDPNGMVVIDSS